MSHRFRDGDACSEFLATSRSTGLQIPAYTCAELHRTTTNKTESDALAHVNSGTWGYNMTHIDCKGAAKDEGHSTHSSIQKAIIKLAPDENTELELP